MKTAVAYIRVSKEKEEGVSPSSQLSKIRQYCSIHDLQLIDVYRDLDISGRSATNRPALQEMLRRIEEGDVRYVVVYKLDRLARSVADFHRLMEHFERHDCDLISVSQNIDTASPVGRLLRNVLVDFAQFESEMIGERIRDNLTHIVESKGKWLGGSPPIGYRQTKDGLVIHEEEAKLVRWIFEQYLSGHGTRAIAGMLNRRGIPTPGGGKVWRYSTVNWILSNPTYIGKAKWQGRVLPGNHQPIIDEATFEQVQRTMRLNNINRRASTGERVLSGLLRCGLCGRSGNVKHGWKGAVRYICVTRAQQDKTACANVALDEESLVAKVYAEICALADPERVARRGREQMAARPKDDVRRELDAIERRLRQIKAAMDRLFEDHYENGIITREQFEEYNRRYLMEQEELIRRREELGGAGEDEEPIDLSIIRDSAASIRESWDALSVSEKRLLVSYVVRRIVWYPDRLEIEWQYGETTTIPYREVRRGVAHV